MVLPFFMLWDISVIGGFVEVFRIFLQTKCRIVIECKQILIDLLRIINYNDKQ